MMRAETPSRVSQSASTRPVGPAPTIRTGTSIPDPPARSLLAVMAHRSEPDTPGFVTDVGSTTPPASGRGWQACRRVEEDHGQPSRGLMGAFPGIPERLLDGRELRLTAGDFAEDLLPFPLLVGRRRTRHRSWPPRNGG